MEIRAIDQTTVHRICSGQVVLTLGVAVKELVENAVDAGASFVEVRLRDHGSKLIEVIDNGQGVEEKNFAALTLKHHTSKIGRFEDLECGVTTFGFRGEALSSLCALSKLTITTRHKDCKVASKIQYDHHGKIIQKAPCARQVGTMVSLEDLFVTLPVRHKEFTRNLKKEFHKMVQLLNAYCVISTGVKITCSNQIGLSGKRTIVVSTNGSNLLRDNISSVFGSKQLNTLREFQLVVPSVEHKEEFTCHLTPEEPPFSVRGFVSSCEHGSGRGSVDRQYYFINGRPCEIEKVSRLLNEVYHSYNKHQYPCVFLNIKTDKGSVDVNVTPDKRKIFLDYEPYLLATMKTSLVTLWEPECSTFISQNINTSFAAMAAVTASQEEEKSRTSLKRTLSDIYKRVKDDQASKKRASLDGFVYNLPRDDSLSVSPSVSQSDQSESSQQSTSQSANTESHSNKLDTDHMESCDPGSLDQDCTDKELGDNSINNKAECPSPTIDQTLLSKSQNKLQSSTESTGTASSNRRAEELANKCNIANELTTYSKDLAQSNPTIPAHNSKSGFVVEFSEPLVIPCEKSESNTESSSQSSVIDETDSSAILCEDGEVSSHKSETLARSSVISQHPCVILDEKPSHKSTKEVFVNFSLSALKQRYTQHCESTDTSIQCPKFRAKIAPDQNSSAESELKQSICKSDFSLMEILGQFNHGFIIARLNSDLFIIDQHASDEKYNFEMLQRHTIMKRQALLVPKPLGLSSDNELLLMDNIEAFHRNGFEFTINEEAEPTMRVSLKTQPVSKNWTFGRDDIDEILYMLRERPGQKFRPSRVRAMFASRACRKSVMIGKPLAESDMKKLVQHMAEIDQPWNCPHGRPTMRHLVNLDLLTL